MEIISRKQAKEQDLKYYFTGKPCPHGHITKKLVTNYACYECHNSRPRNREYAIEYNRVYRKTHPKEMFTALTRDWRRRNPEKVKIAKKTFYDKPEKKRHIIHKAKLRRATKLQRTPDWANLEQIKEIYMNCPEGEHVDHIIPLQGDIVCGLHVEYNLQYLSAFDNIRKKNIFPHPEFHYGF